VKVGLDTKLRAWINEGSFLDTTIVDPPPHAARIVNYNQPVSITVEASQEGVDYQLVVIDGDHEAVVSEADVRGDLHNIRLETAGFPEDTNFRIRATKVFDESEDRETQTQLLDVELVLKVRANTGNPITLRDEIIGYDSAPVLRIGNSQSSARYVVYACSIPDADWIRGSAADDGLVRVSVPDEEAVAIVRPPYQVLWQAPADFIPVTEATAGNDKRLNIRLPNLSEDTVLIVQASKTHTTTRAIESSVQMEQSRIVLVQPDADMLLHLQTVMQGDSTGGRLVVTNGEAGVFYFFRTAPDADPISLPAYFHKRNADDTLNKGLDELPVEVDLVVARGRLSPTVAPPYPLLETTPIPAGSTLHITAMKAQTRVQIPLNNTAAIVALPEMMLDEPVVDYGSNTRIIVVGSVEGDRYQPFLKGEAMKQARNGNGSDIPFVSDAITQDSTFEVQITRPNDSDIPVDRFVYLTAYVRPNNTLAVELEAAEIEYNTQAVIQLNRSESHVRYQLLQDETPVGESQQGSGGRLSFTTDNLTEDTTFTLQATRTDITEPEMTANFAPIAVTVLPEPEPEPPVEAPTAGAPTGAATDTNTATAPDVTSSGSRETPSADAPPADENA